MKHLLPIRKVAVGVVASGAYFVAHKVGLTFNDKDANDVGQAIVGFVVAYIIPDPRVQKAEKAVRVTLRQKLATLNRLIAEANAPTSQPSPVEPTPGTPEA